jgi:predicted amidophosphoribosyltransferase
MISADDRCSRCLQPVPRKAARCPGCGHPASSFRHLPLLIGVTGVFALVFVVAIMYFAVRRADLQNAPPLQDIGAR